MRGPGANSCWEVWGARPPTKKKKKLDFKNFWKRFLKISDESITKVKYKIDHISKTTNHSFFLRQLMNSKIRFRTLRIFFSNFVAKWINFFPFLNDYVSKIQIGKIRKLIFHSIQHCAHLLLKLDHFWGGWVCISLVGKCPTFVKNCIRYSVN